MQGGLESLVSQLLSLPGGAPNARDKDGLTPLHWAASRGKRLADVSVLALLSGLAHSAVSQPQEQTVKSKVLTQLFSRAGCLAMGCACSISWLAEAMCMNWVLHALACSSSWEREWDTAVLRAREAWWTCHRSEGKYAVR